MFSVTIPISFFAVGAHVGLDLRTETDIVQSPSLRADRATCYPHLHEGDELLVGNRRRGAALARVPAPEHKPVALHVLEDGLNGAVAVEHWILERPAQLSDGEHLPEHRGRREAPVRCSRYAGSGIVAHLVMTIAATHGGNAMAVCAANDSWNVWSPCI